MGSINRRRRIRTTTGLKPVPTLAEALGVHGETEEDERWYEAMTAKGHSPVLDRDGFIEMFAYDDEPHNGPACAACGWSCCRHCHDLNDLDVPECDVLEGVAVDPVSLIGVTNGEGHER